MNSFASTFFPSFTPPRFSLLSDTYSTSSECVLLSLLPLFKSKLDPLILFFSWRRSYKHYQYLAKKMNLPLVEMETAGSFVFEEVGQCTEAEMKNKVEMFFKKNSTREVLVVLDGLSEFSLLENNARVVTFVHWIRSFQTYVVGLLHEDVKATEGLRRLLSYEADFLVSLKPLVTGSSVSITGQCIVEKRDVFRGLLLEHRETFYKLVDSGMDIKITA